MSVDAKYTTDRCANCDHARDISQPQLRWCIYWTTELYDCTNIRSDCLHDVRVFSEGLCDNYKRRDV